MLCGAVAPRKADSSSSRLPPHSKAPHSHSRCMWPACRLCLANRQPSHSGHSVTTTTHSVEGSGCRAQSPWGKNKTKHPTSSNCLPLRGEGPFSREDRTPAHACWSEEQ